MRKRYKLELDDKVILKRTKFTTLQNTIGMEGIIIGLEVENVGDKAPADCNYKIESCRKVRRCTYYTVREEITGRIIIDLCSHDLRKVIFTPIQVGICSRSFRS